jgi:hypothetical protein
MITTEDFINIRLLAAAAFVVVLTGCSRNAIEGDVVFVGRVPRPASGVVVFAATETDIKEYKAKAYKRTQTDSSGHFRISGLLATTYRVGVPKDSNPASKGTPLYVPVPEKGTYLIKERIVVCPVPPSAGVWAYIDPTKPPK